MLYPLCFGAPVGPIAGPTRERGPGAPSPVGLLVSQISHRSSPLPQTWLQVGQAHAKAVLLVQLRSLLVVLLAVIVL